MKARIWLAGVAVVFAAGCYPFSPTPQACMMERYPQPCGCPKDGGFLGDSPDDVCLRPGG